MHCLIWLLNYGNEFTSDFTEFGLTFLIINMEQWGIIIVAVPHRQF